jgi:DNA-binding response OmpR family regulator
MLLDNRGEVVTYEQLLLDIWGDDSYYNLRSMNVFVSHLRTKLARLGSVQIASVRGVGYKLGCKE